MALRVTQRQMYTNFTSNMNKNLSELMESNLQSSSQLKINRPSDDPVGAGRVISYRASISRLSINQQSCQSAYGWLSTADGVLAESGSVQTLLNRIKTLAQQGSSGTYDAANREQISYELRETFNQLINLANTSYEGKHIFAGHKTDIAPFVAGLGVTSNNDTFNTAVDGAGSYMVAQGGSKSTVLIQFTGTPGTPVSLDTAAYRYSADGGKTWQTGTAAVSGSDVTLQCGGASLVVRDGAGKGLTVDPVDTANVNETNNGTWLYIRPAAVYRGDDNDNKVTTPYGASVNPNKVEGYFTRDVAVRIDSVDSSGKISYSCSLDDGNTWTQGSSMDPAYLPVPGGYLGFPSAPAAGDQYVIHPRRADINFTISDYDSITVNLVGKEVFGGLYQGPFEKDALPVTGQANLFEVVGRLVAAAETNSQSGMQKAVEELKEVMNHVMTKAAVVGGRENRLSATMDALELRVLSETEGLSKVEDVDVSELMTKMAQQELAYQSVLKSSSMIMQMSLVNFL